MAEHWHGSIRYEHLILDDKATAWMVYEGSGRWRGVVRASRKLPDHIDGLLFYSRDGRRMAVEVEEWQQEKGRSMLKVCASRIGGTGAGQEAKATTR